jgi:hypothetical protein
MKAEQNTITHLLKGHTKTKPHKAKHWQRQTLLPRKEQTDSYKVASQSWSVHTESLLRNLRGRASHTPNNVGPSQKPDQWKRLRQENTCSLSQLVKTVRSCKTSIWRPGWEQGRHCPQRDMRSYSRGRGRHTLKMDVCLYYTAVDACHSVKWHRVICAQLRFM